MTIGWRIRERRREMGYSMEDLSHRAGVTWSAVQRLESGQVSDPHYSTLLGVAHALGMTVAELIGESAPKSSTPPEMGPSYDELLEKALNAARLDAAKNQKARNRLEASEGTQRFTHVTGFESDKVGLELREAGFGDDQVEEFLWPLITQVVEKEREISRLKERLAALAPRVRDAAEASRTLEKIEAEIREREEALEAITRATEEAEERQEARERATNNG